MIDRFSEDIDLTYDIRKLLPGWVEKEVAPLLQAALDQNPAGKGGSIDPQGDKLYLRYPSLTDGVDYVSPAVLLEFGGRATGEPNQTMPVQCDIADHLPSGRVTFPTVPVVVMDIARTFWEKATAAHVYCLQGNFRGGERYARHWFDLAAIANSEYFGRIQADRSVANAVAKHKGWFFREKCPAEM